MKCFVINLPQSTERREKISNILDSQGLDFEIFDASYGKALTKEQLSLFSQEEAVLDLGRGLWGNVKIKIAETLSDGEKGCALSHLRLYQHILDLDLEYACILEDDCLIKDDFNQTLQAIDQGVITEPWDIINFTLHEGMKNCPFAKKYNFNVQGDLQGGYFQRVGLGFDILNVTFNARRLIGETFAYVISKQACKHLIEIGYPIRLPSDYLTGIIAYNKLQVFRCYPLSKFTYASQNQSDIGSRPYHSIKRIKI